VKTLQEGVISATFIAYNTNLYKISVQRQGNKNYKRFSRS